MHSPADRVFVYLRSLHTHAAAVFLYSQFPGKPERRPRCMADNHRRDPWSSSIVMACLSTANRSRRGARRRFRPYRRGRDDAKPCCAGSTAGGRPTFLPRSKRQLRLTLPADFPASVAAETLRRLRAELRARFACRACADLDSRTQGRRVVIAARPHPLEPRRHRADCVSSNSACSRRAQVRTWQAGARSVPARGRAQPGRSGGLHRGRGFGARRCRRSSGGHDSDRLCRRQPHAGQSRHRSPRRRRPHRRRRYAGLKSTITDLRGW